MAEEGANSPGTMADDDGVGSEVWGNVDNAKTQDDSYASVRIGNAFGEGIQQAHYLKATNFGFSIPEGATIDGILVEVDIHQASHEEIIETNIQIVKDGSIGDENKSTGATLALSDTDTYTSYGAVDDLWTESWESADINNANFGVVLSFRSDNSGDSGTAEVDHIRITIYYTLQEISTFSKQVNLNFGGE